MDTNTLIAGDFNTILTAMNRSYRVSIRKQALNDVLDQMDFIDIYRTLHLNTAEYTVFSSTHGTFSRITF